MRRSGDDHEVDKGRRRAKRRRKEEDRQRQVHIKDPGREPTNAGSGTPSSSTLLWTWGRGRKRARRTQIDDVCVSEAVVGRACPLLLTDTVLAKSDHLPVIATLELGFVFDKKATERPRSVKEWAPAGDEARDHFVVAAAQADLDRIWTLLKGGPGRSWTIRRARLPEREGWPSV